MAHGTLPYRDAAERLDFWRPRSRPVILFAMSDVTRILSRIEQGDPRAAEQLLPLVYEQLRKLGAARLRK